MKALGVRECVGMATPIGAAVGGICGLAFFDIATALIFSYAGALLLVVIVIIAAGLTNAVTRRTPAGLAKVFSATAAGTLALSWWLATVPPGPTIDDACRPDGFRASISAWLDGNSYWGSQLSEVRRERKELEAAIAREPQRAEAAAVAMAGVNRVLAEINARNAALMETIYQKRPELRPSAAAERASQLRSMADTLEQEAEMASVRELVERNGLKRIALLTRCEKLIVAEYSR
jgi:hypothetical protein